MLASIIAGVLWFTIGIVYVKWLLVGSAKTSTKHASRWIVLCLKVNLCDRPSVLNLYLIDKR